MNETRQDQASEDPFDPVEARVVAPLRRARLEPDDLQLARLYAALDTALESAPVSPAPVARRGRSAQWGAIGVALAAAAAAVLIAGPMRHRAPPPVASEHARKALAIAIEPDGAASVAPASGPLAVPAGVRFRGRIGERVRFTLVGPGEISACAVAGGADLDLASGRLLVDYDGHGGGETLRVHSPGAVTTVVGTLFAVEALGRTSRVAVARGAVSVEGAGARVQRIAAGRSWLAEAPDTEPIPNDLAADLATRDAAAPASGTGEAAADARAAPPAAASPS